MTRGYGTGVPLPETLTLRTHPPNRPSYVVFLWIFPHFLPPNLSSSYTDSTSVLVSEVDYFVPRNLDLMWGSPQGLVEFNSVLDPETFGYTRPVIYSGLNTSPCIGNGFVEESRLSLKHPPWVDTYYKIVFRCQDHQPHHQTQDFPSRLVIYHRRNSTTLGETYSSEAHPYHGSPKIKQRKGTL